VHPPKLVSGLRAPGEGRRDSTPRLNGRLTVLLLHPEEYVSIYAGLLHARYIGMFSIMTVTLGSALLSELLALRSPVPEAKRPAGTLKQPARVDPEVHRRIDLPQWMIVGDQHPDRDELYLLPRHLCFFSMNSEYNKALEKSRALSAVSGENFPLVKLGSAKAFRKRCRFRWRHKPQATW
jgi:hypothetical protein